MAMNWRLSTFGTVLSICLAPSIALAGNEFVTNSYAPYQAATDDLVTTCSAEINEFIEAYLGSPQMQRSTREMAKGQINAAILHVMNSTSKRDVPGLENGMAFHSTQLASHPPGPQAARRDICFSKRRIQQLGPAATPLSPSPEPRAAPAPKPTQSTALEQAFLTSMKDLEAACAPGPIFPTPLDPSVVASIAKYDLQDVQKQTALENKKFSETNVIDWRMACLLERRESQLKSPTTPVVVTPPPAKAMPALEPPTLKLVSNTGTECLTVEMVNLKMADADNWSFEYKLINHCPTAQLYVAEAQKRNADLIPSPFMGAYPLSVMNPGVWYLWDHPKQPSALKFEAFDPRGEGMRPIKAREVRTGSDLIMADPAQTIYIWLASCEAYAADGRVMAQFRAAGHLSDDGRVQCVPNIRIPGEEPD